MGSVTSIPAATGPVIELEFLERDVFGTPRYYPQNAPAEILARMLKQTTVTLAQIQDAQAMGIRIKWQWCSDETRAALEPKRSRK
jgi:hypothetical protein